MTYSSQFFVQTVFLFFVLFVCRLPMAFFVVLISAPICSHLWLCSEDEHWTERKYDLKPPILPLPTPHWMVLKILFHPSQSGVTMTLDLVFGHAHWWDLQGPLSRLNSKCNVIFSVSPCALWAIYQEHCDWFESHAVLWLEKQPAFRMDVHVHICSVCISTSALTGRQIPTRGPSDGWKRVT